MTSFEQLFLIKSLLDLSKSRDDEEYDANVQRIKDHVPLNVLVLAAIAEDDTINPTARSAAAELAASMYLRIGEAYRLALESMLGLARNEDYRIRRAVARGLSNFTRCSR